MLHHDGTAVGARMLALAGVSLAALALGAPGTQAACTASGNDTTCTGDNASGIITTTSNVIVRDLTSDIQAPAGNPSIIMLNLSNAQIAAGTRTLRVNGVPAIISSGSGSVLVDFQGNIVGTGANTANGGISGVVIGRSSAGADVTIRAVGDIGITASRDGAASPWSNVGIAADASEGVASISSVGNVTLDITGDGSSDINVPNGFLSTTGLMARGSGGAIVSNTGNISLTAQNGPAWGIHASSGNGRAHVTNVGDITVDVMNLNPNDALLFGNAIAASGREVTIDSTGNITTTSPLTGMGIVAVDVFSFDPATNQLVLVRSDISRVTSTGNISTAGRESTGIHVAAVESFITSTGNISTLGDVSPAITGIGDDVTVKSAGSLTTRGDSSPGVLLAGDYSLTDGRFDLIDAADVGIVTSEGDITTAGELSPGVAAFGLDLTINSTGNISTANWDSPGVYASAGLGADPSGMADEFADSIVINSTGNITALRADGISATGRAVTVNSTGNISAAVDGVFVHGGADGVSIRSSGNVTAGEAAIWAFTDSGDISISVSGAHASTAAPGSPLYRDSSAIIAYSNTGAINVEVSGSIASTSDGVWLSGNGTKTVTVQQGAVVAADGVGVSISSETASGANSSAPITVVNRGRISGGAIDLTGVPGLHAGAGARGVSFVSDSHFTGAKRFTNHGVVDGGFAFNWNAVDGIVLGGQGRFENAAGGVFSGGFGVAPQIVNAGVFSPGGDDAVDVMSFVGDFTQTASGRYHLNLDFADMTADRIDVTGSAALAGEVVVVPLNFSPQSLQPGTNTFRIVNATGGVINNGLSVADSLLVAYDLGFSANAVDLTATVDFAPAGISERSGAVSTALGALTTSDQPADQYLSGVLTAILSASSAAEVEAIVRQLSPDSLASQGEVAAPGVMVLAGGMFSCGEREGDNRFAREGDCGWARLGARAFEHDGSLTTPAFREDAISLMGGAQAAVSEHWRLGVSAGVEQSDLSVPGLASVETNRYQFGAVAKGRWGALTTALAATAGWADAETRRFLPVIAGVAESEQDISFYGLHGRLAYTQELGGGAWYVRPQVRLDAIHMSIGAFQETGVGAVGLSVAKRDDWLLSVTPGLEIGGELQDGATLMRPWLRVGVSLYEDTTSTTTANFVGAPAGAIPFVTTSIGDDVYGEIGAGVNVLTGGRFELRVGYEGRFSGKTTAHDGTLKFIRRF